MAEHDGYTLDDMLSFWLLSQKFVTARLNDKMPETHPQVFDLFVLFQFLKERLEKVSSLYMAWSHT